MSEEKAPFQTDPPAGMSIPAELSIDDFGAADHRAAERVDVAMEAALRKSGGSVIPIHLMDLSTHGFRTETHLYVDPGDTVWVRLPGIESMPAIVKWVRGSLIGCAFERPLYPPVFERMVGLGSS